MKTIVITGATGGLGREVTRRLLRDYTCVVFYRNEARFRELVEAAGRPANLHGIVANLTDAASVSDAIEETAAAHDVPYALVHLAGAFAAGSTEETSLDDFERLFETNFTSAFVAVRAILPHLRHRKSGRIIAIGSSAVAARNPGMVAYNVSKSALITFMESLGRELDGSGITANVLLPGSLATPAMKESGATDLVPLERVAETIAVLLSDHASAINGAAIHIA